MRTQLNNFISLQVSHCLPLDVEMIDQLSTLEVLCEATMLGMCNS